MRPEDDRPDGVAGRYIVGVQDADTPVIWTDGYARLLSGPHAFAVNSHGGGPAMAPPVVWPSASTIPISLPPLAPGTGISQGVANTITEADVIGGSDSGLPVLWSCQPHPGPVQRRPTTPATT
jgi:hypothetical protein